jgi:hypothetical protein
MYYKDKDSTQIFYAIKPNEGNIYGLGALIIETLKYIQYAEQMGYIPVVDWRKDTQYSDELSKKNAWNYFFKPLKGKDIEEISKSPNTYIIESKVSDLKKLDEKQRISKSFDSDNLSRARKMFIDYFEFSDIINEKLDKIEFDGLDTAGFYLRGTDYAVLKPQKHAIQPNVALAIKKMNQVISKYGFSRIFLVTEDKKIFDEVKSYYGNRLVCLPFDRHIEDYAGTSFLLDDMHSLNQLGDNAKVRGINYFVKLILLSRCGCIVGGNTCGSWLSAVLSTSFKEKYIFNLGEYT